MAASNKLLTDFASTVKNIPSNYVRPISERPNLSDIHTSDASIPLIDLQDLCGSNHYNVIKQIAMACQYDGFFQVKNHGISEVVINEMMRSAKEFFQLPEGERVKYCSKDPYRITKLSTSFNVETEKYASWRDFLRINCYPLEDHMPDWPSNPSIFKEVVAEYSTSVRGLVLKLLEAISESLGLKKDHISKTLGKHTQYIVFNYYPPCPEPELTFGLPSHSDANAITIVLLDDTPGLQVLKNDKWISINPIPNTFIVNIGEQIQVISNDRYKSVLHRAIVNRYFKKKRAIVNRDHRRISIPTFYGPSPDALIGPATELVDDENPAVYKSFIFGEFFKNFLDRGLNTESSLDFFKT